MKIEPPADGLQRHYHPDGTLREAYRLKDRVVHGLFRRWHENGQLAERCVYKQGKAEGAWSHWNDRGELLGVDHFKNGTGISRQWHPNGALSAEFSYFRGGMTGPMRHWDADGMFLGRQFFFEDRPISKRRYLEMCAANPALPRFEETKESNTFGKYLRQLRKEMRTARTAGSTEEQRQADAEFDKEYAAEARAKGSREVVSWLEAGKRNQRELGEFGRAEALRLSRRLYRLGAVKIWATRIERDPDGFQCSKRLVVKLPRDLGKRAAMYEHCVDHARPFITTGTPAIRTGRKFMSISLL